MKYQWIRIVDKKTGRAFWKICALSFILSINACAPKQINNTTNARAYMETQAEFYEAHGVDEREECLDTDDLSNEEINAFAKTNGCAEYFIEMGIKF